MDYPTKFTIRVDDRIALLIHHQAQRFACSPTAVATKLLEKAVCEFLVFDDEKPTEANEEILWRLMLLMALGLQNKSPEAKEGLERITRKQAKELLESSGVRPASEWNPDD